MSYWAIGHKKDEELYLCSKLFWTEQEAVQRAREFSSMDSYNTYVVVEIDNFKTAEYKNGKKIIL